MTLCLSFHSGSRKPMSSRDLLRLFFARLSLLVTYWLASPTFAGDAADGLWLLARKDPQNTARADVPGEMTVAPREVWKFGGDALTYSAAISGNGRRR